MRRSRMASTTSPPDFGPWPKALYFDGLAEKSHYYQFYLEWSEWHTNDSSAWGFTSNLAVFGPGRDKEIREGAGLSVRQGQVENEAISEC